MRTLLTAALVAALPLASANAEIITVKYEGTLPTTELLWDHDVVVAGTITFDTDQVIRSEATFIAYEIIEHKATLEGIGTFVDIGGSVYVYNDQWVDGQYMDPFYSSYVLVAQVIQGFTFVDMALQLETINAAPGGGPLSSLALPSTLTKDTFNVARIHAVFYQAGSIHVPGSVTRLEVLTDSGPLAVECDGFAAPFDAAVGLSNKAQRVIPLRMEIFDGDFPLGPADIAPPTVSVSYSSSIRGGEPAELVESAGKASSGNSFVWDEASQRWAFNLATKPYTAAGTYTVTAVAGDEEYVLSPTCSGTFVRQ